MQGVADVFSFNLKKSTAVVALGSRDGGCRRCGAGAGAVGRSSFQRKAGGLDSLLPALALQKGRAVPHFCSPVCNKDTVLLLCQAEGRLALCSVKTQSLKHFRKATKFQ